MAKMRNKSTQVEIHDFLWLIHGWFPLYSRNHNGFLAFSPWKQRIFAMTNWLLVSTPLKNISQLGWLFPIYGKMFQTTNQLSMKLVDLGHRWRTPIPHSPQWHHGKRQSSCSSLRGPETRELWSLKPSGFTEPPALKKALLGLLHSIPWKQRG
jgi:hypothetical protein